MTWLGAVFQLWAEDYCFKHRKKRVGLRYTHCRECERERGVPKPEINKTDLAKEKLGWK